MLDVGRWTLDACLGEGEISSVRMNILFDYCWEVDKSYQTTETFLPI